MDIIETFKGLLPKVGFTWDALLRLFYSLCGWLAIGTTIPIAGASEHTPIGVLRRLLDWLDAPSAFTLGMERWYDSHAVLLTVLGLGVMLISITLSCMVSGRHERVFGMEIPPFSRPSALPSGRRRYAFHARLSRRRMDRRSRRHPDQSFHTDP